MPYLVINMERATQTATIRFPCPDCDKTYAGTGGLKQHMDLKHPTPDQKPKHNEHLKRSLKNESLDSMFLGHESIVAYFSIKVSPTHASSVNATIIITFLLS